MCFGCQALCCFGPTLWITQGGRALLLMSKRLRGRQPSDDAGALRIVGADTLTKGLGRIINLLQMHITTYNIIVPVWVHSQHTFKL